MAIRPEGQGDVTKTHLAWVAEENIPDVTSPVSNGELLFTVNSGGIMACWDVKTGKKVWDHDYEMEFQASPVLAGDRIYIFSGKNAAMIVQAGREFKQLARIEMDDKFYASPAIVQNRIYLRGAKQLYCIGTKDSATIAGK
jgi:outer membrane protein assembly factor BamB